MAFYDELDNPSNFVTRSRDNPRNAVGVFDLPPRTRPPSKLDLGPLDLPRETVPSIGLGFSGWDG